MPQLIARRLVLIATLALGAALSACTNPVAPARTAAPSTEPSAGVYMGGIG